jgi:hypothetical protein
MEMKLALSCAVILSLAMPAQAFAAESDHSIQMMLQIEGTSGNIYVPGVGEMGSSSFSNTSYTAMKHNYISHYNSNLLKSLVFNGAGMHSMSIGRSGNNIMIKVNQTLGGSNALVAFTRGGIDAVENRMTDIESGSFFYKPEPTFGFGLGYDYAIKLLINYPDIDITGDMALQSGRQGIMISYNGTAPDNKQKILFQQKTADV